MLCQRARTYSSPQTVTLRLLLDKLLVAAAQAVDRAAVLPLRQLQEIHPSLLELNPIHEELDRAIEKIQSQLEQNEAGDLFVAE